MYPNKKEALISYLESQIEKTKLQLNDCDRFAHPSVESYIDNLEFRLEWLEFQYKTLNRK